MKIVVNFCTKKLNRLRMKVKILVNCSISKVESIAWEESEVPEDWRRAIIVPLYKEKGSREECNNYKGISRLSVPGKIYGRILNEKTKITDKSMGDEQGDIRKGRDVSIKFLQ